MHIVNTAKTFLSKFSSDWSMNLVSMVTYSLVTTIFPLLVGILTIAAIILGFLPGYKLSELANSISGVLPSSLDQVINVSKLLKTLPKITGPLALISIVGLLWTGSNLFTNIENAFSVIFRVPDRTFIPQRMMGIGMVIILAILLPLSLAASSFVTAGSKAFSSALPGPLSVILAFVGPLVSIIILWLLFLAIYIIVPNIKVPFRHAWRGALTAAILFGLIQLLFPIYFTVFLSGNAKYGAAAGTILVLVAWLWIFALITIIGAQVNAVALGIKPFQADLAHTLAKEYQDQLTAQPPVRRSRIPRPRAKHVTPIGRAVGKTTGAVSLAAGKVLAPPLRLLALAGWLVARPVVRESERDRGRAGS